MRAGPREWFASMRRGRRLLPQGRGRVVAAVLGALIVAGAVAHIISDRVTALPAGAVLRANGVVVTEPEFVRRVDVLTALYGLRVPPEGPERDLFDRNVAKAIAASLILDQAAAESGVVVSEKEAQDRLTKVLEANFARGRDTFVQTLNAAGLTEQDVLAELRRQMTSARLLDQVTADLAPVTDADIRLAYVEREQELVTPEQRRLRNIVLDTRERADQVLAQARSGADFAALAAQYSLDGSTKQAGGDLGFMSMDQLEKTYAEAARVTGAGGFFGPVQTQYGWNVGQVLEVRPPTKPTFEQAAERLRTDIENERKQEAWRTYFGDRIEDADVEYSDGYRPSDPDALPPLP